jgi:uncharacterized protein YjbI with pentapeptide repeats
MPPGRKNLRRREEGQFKPPAPDIQAILTVLGRCARTFERGQDQRLDLRATDLRGAALSGAHLEGAHLQAAVLTVAIGLTMQQIELAITDKNTKLPDYITWQKRPT